MMFVKCVNALGGVYNEIDQHLIVMELSLNDLVVFRVS